MSHLLWADVLILLLYNASLNSINCYDISRCRLLIGVWSLWSNKNNVFLWSDGNNHLCASYQSRFWPRYDTSPSRASFGKLEKAIKKIHTKRLSWYIIERSGEFTLKNVPSILLIMTHTLSRIREINITTRSYNRLLLCQFFPLNHLPLRCFDIYDVVICL